MTNLDQKLLFAVSTCRFFICRVTVISGMQVYLLNYAPRQQTTGQSWRPDGESESRHDQRVFIVPTITE